MLRQDHKPIRPCKKANRLEWRWERKTGTSRRRGHDRYTTKHPLAAQGGILILLAPRLLLVLCSFLLLPLGSSAEPTTASTPPPPSRTPDGTPPELVRLEEHFGLVTSGPGFDRLQRVSERLLASLQEDWRPRIKAIRILDDETLNAFATPSGYIYFFQGLINELETDDQCAAVLAHEMTHILHKHSQEIGRDAWKFQLGGLLAAIIAKEPGLYTAGQVLGHNSVMSYSRKAETDADETGLLLMTKAGYEPVGMLEFMSRLEWASASNPLLEEGYFLTHPYPVERRQAISAWMVARNYPVPVQIQKMRAPVTIEPWSETPDGPVAHLCLHVGGIEVFRFAGRPEESQPRADRAVIRLQAVLEAGALDYDFASRQTAQGTEIYTRHGVVFVLTPDDAALAGMTEAELGTATVQRLKQVLWQRRIKQRLG